MELASPQQCHRHSRPASYVNTLNGELLCDYDELLYRRSPRHSDLAPLGPDGLVSPSHTEGGGLRDSSAAGETVVFSLDVDCARFLLCDTDSDATDSDAIPVGPSGEQVLISCHDGMCTLSTGRESGSVSLAVVLAIDDPGADLGYADIAEASIEFRTPEAHLRSDMGQRQKLPRLPAGAGAYRLRYHARNMVGAQRHNQPVDEYLLQIWPGGREAPPMTLRSTLAGDPA